MNEVPVCGVLFELFDHMSSYQLNSVDYKLFFFFKKRSVSPV